MGLSKEELLNAVDSMNQATLSDGKRAPHKPLFLLWLLGQLRATGTSDVSYSAVEGPVSDLINLFGPPAVNHRYRAELPFFHLDDSLWILDSKNQLEPKRSKLLASDARGQLRPEVESMLLSEPALIEEVALHVIERQFTETYLEPILTKVGLEMPDLVSTSTGGTKKKRDPKFREGVMIAWRGQCAMCGYDGMNAGLPVGIEAAHVKWFSQGGPDTLENGMALCELHHALFDLGILGLTVDLKIKVAPSFIGKNEASERLVYALEDQDLREPAPSKPTPSSDFILWHSLQVFKSSNVA